MTSAPGSHRVFVYGTLKLGESNHHYLQDSSLGGATLLGTAWTVDAWPLVVDPGSYLPFMLRKKGQGKKILGEIYKVDDNMLSFLDHFEGVPNFYTRETINVQPIGAFKEEGGDADSSKADGHSPIECFCYMCKEPDDTLLEQPFLEVYRYLVE